MNPIFFSSQLEWHDWLSEHYDKEPEVWIGFYKAKSGIKGITNKEAVDEALCFGWIDAVVYGIDDQTWKKRFTPRKSKSIWSLANVKRVDELTALGLMQPSGLAAFAKKEEKRSGIYSFESDAKSFSGTYLEMFIANTPAWSFFLSTPPSYKRPATHWVLTAKQEETRMRRMQKLIEVSSIGKRLDHLVSPGKK